MVLISRSRRALARRGLAAALLLAGLAVLAGCGSMIADNMPTAVGGLPESAPQRPTNPAAYPAVHDLPPPRSEAVLTSEEQRKLEDDLIAARDRAAGNKPGGKPAGSARNP
jgi:hypothetical protein